MSKPTYTDGLNDGQQVKIYMDFRRIRHYIEEFMGNDLYVILDDEGTKTAIPTAKFADDLAKVIIKRQTAPKDTKDGR